MYIDIYIYEFQTNLCLSRGPHLVKDDVEYCGNKKNIHQIDLLWE